MLFDIIVCILQIKIITVPVVRGQVVVAFLFTVILVGIMVNLSIL